MRGFPALKATPIRSSSVPSFSYPPKKSALHVEGVSLVSLAEKYGTPLYVYSASQILERYRLFSRAFAARPHLLCYSVKANSNLSILKLLARQGSGFDIVSGGELVRVLRVSKKAARRVVFSGVGKTAEEMDLALKSEILIFNVESQAEVALLAERAQKLRKRARVALRVNPDVFAETHPYISTGLREHKFGIDIRGARELYQQVKRCASLQPVGVSVHIGSQIRDAAPFGAAMERVAPLIRELETDGIRIGFVDAGGGLGSNIAGKVQSIATAKPSTLSPQCPLTPRRSTGRSRASMSAFFSSRADSSLPRPARSWRVCSTSRKTGRRPSRLRMPE